MPDSSSKGQLKNTFLLSSVQIINILIKVFQNKVAAIALGTSGMGILGLLTNNIQFLSTGAGLGISQSAVRDIAAAEERNDSDTVNLTYTITNRIVIYTGLLGLIITVLFSGIFSKIVFGDTSYTWSYIILSVVVFCNIVSEGKLAILKGKRKFKDLAKCTIAGSIMGFIIVVPIYWFLKDQGIVLSLILIAVAQYIYVNIYVNRCHYEKVELSLRECFKGANPIIKMGISLMIVSFVSIIFNLIVATFIRNIGSLSDVGVYNAGATILTTYFGVLITAMSTDFYPRVSAVYDDNKELTVLINNQCFLCLALLFPIVVLFVFASPFFIKFLYTGDFLQATEYTDYAMIGTILLVCSNFLGIILLAKQKSKIFLTSVFSQRIFLLLVYYLFYNIWGIKGLGYSYIVMGLSDIILMTVIMNHYFQIRLKRNVLALVLIELLFTIACMWFKTFENIFVRYSFGFVLFFLSALISYLVLKKELNINIIRLAINKLRKS
jgi:O-antigen/teichoic acid export membrane protein